MPLKNLKLSKAFNLIKKQRFILFLAYKYPYCCLFFNLSFVIRAQIPAIVPAPSPFGLPSGARHSETNHSIFFVAIAKASQSVEAIVWYLQK